MRKLLLAGSFVLAMFVSGVAATGARADHGYGGYGYRNPGCQHGGYRSGYTSYHLNYGVPRVYQPYNTGLYRIAPVVPVYPGSVYQPYGLGVSPYVYGGGMYGGGFYGSGYGTGLPRVQLRVGF